MSEPMRADWYSHHAITFDGTDEQWQAVCDAWDEIVPWPEPDEADDDIDDDDEGDTTPFYLGPDDWENDQHPVRDCPDRCWVEYGISWWMSADTISTLIGDYRTRFPDITFTYHYLGNET